MRSFGSNNQPSRFAKYRTLLIATIVIMLGGAGLAAAGGADIVRSWFITVELVGEDGQVFTGVLEPVEGEDGIATMDLDLGNGQQATLEVRRLSDLGDDDPLSQLGEDATMVTVTLNGDASAEGDGQAKTITMIQADGGEHASMIIERLAPGSEQIGGDQVEGETRTVKLSFTANGGGETDASIDVAQAMQAFTARAGADRIIVTEIAEADEVFDWTDGNNVARELSVVRNDVDDPDGDGFRIYTTLDDGSFMEVGAIITDAADELEAVDFEVRDNGIGVITFIDGDDHEIVLEMLGVDGSDRAGKLTARTLTIEQSGDNGAARSQPRHKADGQRE